MKDLFQNNTISICYPLRFTPIIKERIWGGTKLNSLLNKELGSIVDAGESWEISTIEGNISILENGTLKGFSLIELLNIYGAEILGHDLFQEFGNNFPLLIKFLHSKEDLSIQVHPDDEIAKKRHNSLGKTEMWYVLDAEQGSKIVCGFKSAITKEEYIERVNNSTLPEVLDQIEVKSGDVFFIPTGRIHALGGGVVLAEVQQTSDITYRIYDYNRIDKKGQKRELHTEWALECIDFKVDKSLNKHFQKTNHELTNIETCKYFTTNLLSLDTTIEIDHSKRDNFTILMCVEGSGEIRFSNSVEIIKMGDTILMPACLKSYNLTPSLGILKLLEIYI